MKGSVNKLLTSILGFLLHHANRLGADTAFYTIKARLLKQYGTPDGYDIQQIPGKPCDGCGGDGTYHAFRDDEAMCHSCEGSGWYKDPFYCKLDRFTLGGYLFHTPGKRQYLKTPSEEELAGAKQGISRYITHADPSRYAEWCKMTLFLLFNFNEFAYRITPYSWRNPGHYTWHLWKPAHIWQNFKHILSWAIRTKGKHIPLFKDLRQQRENERNHRLAMSNYRAEQANLTLSDDDLPF